MITTLIIQQNTCQLLSLVSDFSCLFSCLIYYEDDVGTIIQPEIMIMNIQFLIVNEVLQEYFFFIQILINFYFEHLLYKIQKCLL